MSQVTSIKRQKKNRQRFNIYIDGQFAAGIDEKTLTELNLQEGQEVGQATLDRLPFYSKKSRLYEMSLNFLEYRPRSQQEIRHYLERKIRQKKIVFDSPQIRKQAIEGILDDLERLNLIDDFAFGQWWIDQRQSARKPKGKWALRSELKAKGLDPKTINSLLEQNISRDKEKQLASQCLTRRFGNRPKNIGPDLRNKAYRYLARRGFDYDLIREIIEELEVKVNKS